MNESKSNSWPSDYWQQCFQKSGPAYILDSNYCFTNWNACFEQLFAQNFSLSKGQHVGDLVSHFSNKDEVIERATRIFGIGNIPLVDIEPITISFPDFGEVTFQKIATQIKNEEKNQQFWAIHLNVCKAEHPDKLWNFIQQSITNTFTS